MPVNKEAALGGGRSRCAQRIETRLTALDQRRTEVEATHPFSNTNAIHRWGVISEHFMHEWSAAAIHRRQMA